jgi:hypothetical protein
LEELSSKRDKVKSEQEQEKKEDGPGEVKRAVADVVFAGAVPAPPPLVLPQADPAAAEIPTEEVFHPRKQFEEIVDQVSLEVLDRNGKWPEFVTQEFVVDILEDVIKEVVSAAAVGS